MNFFLIVTTMSASMSGDPRPTRDHVVNETYRSQAECYASLQEHMTIELRPGHMWTGTVRHPNGQFKQCQ